MSANGAGRAGVHAIYPGSFDPPTMGHLDVIERAAAVFDRLTVAVVVNPQKREPMFTLAERKAMLVEIVAHLPHVDVEDFRGLLAEYVKSKDANVIVKGLRVVSDFETELSTALMNRSLSSVDTMFLMSDPRFLFVSSSMLKEVYLLGGEIDSYVPPAVMRFMREKRATLRP